MSHRSDDLEAVIQHSTKKIYTSITSEISTNVYKDTLSCYPSNFRKRNIHKLNNSFSKFKIIIK